MDLKTFDKLTILFPLLKLVQGKIIKFQSLLGLNNLLLKSQIIKQFNADSFKKDIASTKVDAITLMEIRM
jgi:hypothetical protein